MWNAMKTKSLAAALLISTTIHGSLFWKMNEVATEAAAGTAQTSLNSRPAESAASSPAIRYVTLEPVLVVGKYSPFMPDQIATQAENSSQFAQARCINTRANPVARNGQNDGTTDSC